MGRPTRAARMSEWVLHCEVKQRHIRRSQPTRDAIQSGTRLSAGWTSPPQLTDQAGHTETLGPQTDLKPNDIINVTAPVCPEYARLSGHTSPTAARMVYGWANSLFGAQFPSQMSLLLNGKKADQAATSGSQHAGTTPTVTDQNQAGSAAIWRAARVTS
jgi:hypothetical protein